MKTRKVLGILALALGVSVMSLFGGCGSKAAVNESNSEVSQNADENSNENELGSEDSNSSENTENSDENNETEKAEEKITIAYPDNMQERGFKEALVLEKMPVKVVSMSNLPVITLDELGVNMVAIPESSVANWSEDLDAKTTKLKVAMNSNFDIETVIALEPDLVIMNYSNKEDYGKIVEEANVPVYYVDAGHTVSYDSIKKVTQELINAFGKDTEKGKEIMARFDATEKRLAKCKETYAGKTVMVMLSSPPSHYVQTKNATLGSMLDMIGFTNVVDNPRAPMLPMDMEKAIEYVPDYVFVVGASKTSEEFETIMAKAFAENEDYWNSVDAIKDGNIIYLPVQYIASSGIDDLDKINDLIDLIEAKYGEK